MIVDKMNFKKYVLELSKNGKRADGRGLLEYRTPVKIEYNISANAEGSASVTMGKTRVVCGIKAAIGTPYPDSQDEGTMMVTAEFAAISSPDFEPGAPGENSIELARIVDRGIRESGAIDTKKLCITKGEKVWTIYIDIYIQNHDGNLIDAAALAAISALHNAKFPKLNEDGKIDYDQHTDENIPVVKKPIACTIVKIGENLFIDATADEEAVADARITITSDENNTINAMQKGGANGMTTEEIEKCVDLAIEKANELRSHM